MKRIPAWSLAATLGLGAVAFCCGHAQAQDKPGEPVHWAYSAFLGTGWYSLDSSREVYVLRIPPSWVYRTSSADETGWDRLGIEFHFPLTLGVHTFGDVGDLVDFDNIGTASVNPGVEIEYPVTERWRLRAYASFGWGREYVQDERAWIYDAGLKGRFALQTGKLDWGLFGQVFVAGYDAKHGHNDKFTGTLAGLDFSYPIGSAPGASTAFKLNWDIGYRWYENDPKFMRTASDPVSIQDNWEIGLALARQDGPFKLWFMSFEQLGLVYRFDGDGSFKSISVNVRMPFTR